ncbi:alpha/beta fold hydrolase [Knoellia sp. LjRoot47]|uniref:alpha/beta fold hydrolase n=1 Tax=Knoellia sp. LjRoot47 TaxID=3342330 RepID=UPI003ECF2EE8
MSDLDVTGGVGGVEVAVEDLRRAASRLRATADVVEGATPERWRAPPWGLPSVSPELAHLVVRARLAGAAVSDAVGHVVDRLHGLADSTDRAATGYERAEATTRGLVSGLHDQAMSLAWLVSEATGRAFGLLDEGEGWDVAVTRVAAPACVPAPASTDSLLAGVQTLGDADSRGGVRVVELAAGDGTTTWVVQVPGTHGGWAEGGDVPMDWPANVSLMLSATSASKVAVARALDLAQAGRAGPRDRVVLVGHSQGGIVAAALASDPAFTRSHRVTHVVTAGSPIDDFPIPDATQVLSLQHATDPVHALDVSPPPDRSSWTTVEAAAPVGLRAHLTAGAHALSAYRATAARVDRSDDVSLRDWRAGLAPALALAPGAQPVVHEFRSERRWQNRDS